MTSLYNSFLHFVLNLLRYPLNLFQFFYPTHAFCKVNSTDKRMPCASKSLLNSFLLYLNNFFETDYSFTLLTPFCKAFWYKMGEQQRQADALRIQIFAALFPTIYGLYPYNFFETNHSFTCLCLFVKHSGSRWATSKNKRVSCASKSLLHWRTAPEVRLYDSYWTWGCFSTIYGLYPHNFFETNHSFTLFMPFCNAFWFTMGDQRGPAKTGGCLEHPNLCCTRELLPRFGYIPRTEPEEQSSSAAKIWM